MSDLSSALTEANAVDWEQDAAWREFTAALISRTLPHAIAVIANAAQHGALLSALARRLLCLSSTGKDGCASCMSWDSGEHPDLLIAGDEESAPGIADCQGIARELAMEPFSAPGRLAVIRSADSLSLPAANSLLKVTEEPPAKGRIIYIAKEDVLIPTIRSRVWVLNFLSRATECEPVRPPVGAREWGAWFEKCKTSGKERRAANEVIGSQIESWVAWLSRERRFSEASDLENLSQYVKKRNLSTTMMQDLLFAVLEEGTTIEEIFGEFREA